MSVALFIVLLPLLWRTIGIAIADLTWSRAPMMALFFDPDLAKAREAYALSLLTLDLPDAVTAEQELHEVIKRDPVAPDVVTSLAKLYTAQRQTDRALQLWPLAAASARRDGEAQLQAFQIAMKAQDYKPALLNIDALMRAYPGDADKIVGRIVPYLENAAFRTALIEVLAAGAPWRPDFLSAVGSVPVSMASINDVYDALKTSPVPLTADELRPYLKRLVANKFYENAYLIWVSSLPETMKPLDAGLYNGSFQYPLTNMPFDWSVDPVPGVDVGVEKKVFTRSLRVTFTHTRSRFQNVRQILFLAPGDYVFSGRESSDLLVNDRGVRWRIHCADDQDGALVVTAPLNDTIPWRDFSVAFSVPSACPVQEILLEIPARSLGEQAASGTAAYTALQIQPTATPVEAVQ